MKRFGILCFALLALSCHKNSEHPTDKNPYSNERAVGASAHDLLSAARYDSLAIQIQYMEGNAPDAGAVSHLKSFLEARLNKPGGIRIDQQSIPATSGKVLTSGQVNALEKKYRTLFTSGKQAGVYVLYTNGDYSDNQVLGISYKNTSICIFGKTLSDHSGGLGNPGITTLTATVFEHEFGHLLGLVNTGSPMQEAHEDAQHPHHCNNNECLMYYAAETTDILGFLSGGTIPQPDAKCLNDLRANGGK